MGKALPDETSGLVVVCLKSHIILETNTHNNRERRTDVRAKHIHSVSRTYGLLVA